MDDPGPLRAPFLDAIRTCPGASTREVARRAGRSEWTTDYHLRRMLKEGLIVSEPRGRERAWFVAACGLCPVLRVAIPTLRRPEALAVAMAVDETPAIAAVVAKRAGLSLGATRWAARPLVDAFLVERSASGRLALRPGAQTCVSKAAQGARCELWGKCPVSRDWRRAREREAVALTSSR